MKKKYGKAYFLFFYREQSMNDACWDSEQWLIGAVFILPWWNVATWVADVEAIWVPAEV